MATKKEKNITTFNEHLNLRYGKRGSKKRIMFEIKANAFLLAEVIKVYPASRKRIGIVKGQK